MVFLTSTRDVTSLELTSNMPRAIYPDHVDDSPEISPRGDPAPTPQGSPEGAWPERVSTSL